MNERRMVTNWDATLRLARWLAVAVTVLAVAVLVLAFRQLFMMERQTLVPPSLNDRATIERSKASESYLTAWGMYVATTLGGVTPSNAQTVANLIGPQVDGRLWHTLRAQILAVADDPTYTRVGAFSLFTPSRVFAENEGYRVFVEGKLSELSYREVNKAVAIVATYEMDFEVRNGLPILIALNSYPGEARTALWKSKNAAKLAALEKAGGKEAERARLRASRDELMRAQADEEERLAREDAQKKQAVSAAVPPAQSGAVQRDGLTSEQPKSTPSSIDAASPPTSTSR